jgi:anti-sigma regulatory factor (Ser/Thr protein kinase)
MDKSFTNYHIGDRSFVAYVKREIHNEVLHANFSENQVGQIDIIVSELCSNVVKHAGGGQVLYRTLQSNRNHATFEIICFDNGPGIKDPKKMMKDGISTTKTLGQGLGAIERLSSASQLYSIPGWGTVHYSMVTSKKNVEATVCPIEVRGLAVMKPREKYCGDGYRIKRNISNVQIFFGDGLGHGLHAKEAVDLAGEFFMSSNEEDPVEIMKQMHEHVRRSRGLVATVAVYDKKSNHWRICGVGNILTRVYAGITYKNYMSYNGTVGLNVPASMNNSIFPAEKNQHLILCSDGLRTRWDISKYPAILKYDNIVLATALYKDFSRGNDDSSILVAKVI